MGKSLQQLLITNYNLSPSGYTGSQGGVGYVGSAGTSGVNGYTGSAGTINGLPIGTTAERPVSPIDGTIRINTTLSSVEVFYSNVWTSIAGVGLGKSSLAPAASATALAAAGFSINGNYWININGISTEVYVDFTLNGGPYILVMVAASTGTAYDYDSTVWTNTTGGVTTALDPALDTNQVSAAFYNLATTRTGLALRNPSSSYFHYLDHTSGTPRALANGSPAPTAATPNGTTIAPNNIIPSASPARALGWWNAVVDSGLTAATNGSTYYRYGYSHGTPEPSQFGYCRFGFTADQDSSDSRDRGIGIGIKNAGGGPVASFSASAGRFDYNDGTTGYKNNLRGFLYIKN
jgi:hypothetical protein